MSESTSLRALPLAPVACTLLAIVVSLFVRHFFMPSWSPVVDPDKDLSLMILWFMSTLPVVYLSFRRWAQDSIQSYFPQVGLFLVLAFGLQTALKAATLGFEMLNISAPYAMPFVWALPWMALVTTFKTSYVTAAQCTKLTLVLLPIVLVLQVLFMYLPLFALAYYGTATAAASLFSIVIVLYATAAWRLSRAKNV